MGDKGESETGENRGRVRIGDEEESETRENRRPGRIGDEGVMPSA